jgi:hypothetical protein
MIQYRLHCIAGGTIRETTHFQASDDAEALALVGLRGETTDCELWCGERRVAVIPTGGEAVLG